MTLTSKQEKFSQCIADGMTQADAYRTAYDAAKMKDATIHVQASKMLADPKIATRVAELRSKLAKKALWTREMSVKALMTAYQGGNGSVKVAAVKELNAMHGYSEPMKIDHSSSDGTMTPKMSYRIVK
jgi:hypothetical protein